ncbi:retrovirus-related Pol polyprotein from transposon TNT 1-94 [Trichonephila clavipes]|uniref:Retrovirus-related Pol polyprotein from transposon TNT 1-94 n=1 Tax=Trichonephila clavipes TaxID=2585209 RepID=A0A8X6V9B2_TRICX|nr:retrovirus-related Pol polyprotein from transposon TNT 1-94 [Trichonephila clavipes]
MGKKSENKNNSNITTEEKLNRLKDSFKGTLTRLEAFTSEKTVSKDTSVTEIEIKLKKIEQLQINLDKIAEDYCEIETFESLKIIQLDIEDINQRIETTESQQQTNCCLICEPSLDITVNKFFELESLPDDSKEITKSEEEIYCEEHFVSTYKRDKTERFIVRLPIKENAETLLGYSKQNAIKRLNGIWEKLSENNTIGTLYKEFMNEYELLGHMEEIKNETLDKIKYYIPHHSVYKPEKTSTPLRVVFVASAKTTSGFSLNSILLNGGIIQQDLFSIVSRFRKHEYAFSADIKKMYRQILVDPNQRDLQRIMWKTSANAPVNTYKLATVTYGTVSAPFLATRTLKALADEEKVEFPDAADVICNDSYMDDIISEESTLESAKNEKYKYPVSSLPISKGQVLSKLDSPKTSEEILTVPYRNLIGSLSFIAICTRPDIMYAVNVLSQFQANPGIKHWNCLLRLLGYLKYTQEYKLELSKVKSLKLRCYSDSDFATNRDDRVSMGGFITFIDETPISWRTFQQKSVSLSTMEAEYVSLTEAAKEFIWLKNFTNKCNNWKHVSSKNNPADLISRGYNVDELLKNEMWFSGPDLQTDEYEDNQLFPDSSYRDELKCAVTLSMTECSSNFYDELFNVTNNFIKLIRIFSFIFRFINNIKAKESCNKEKYLTSDEIKRSTEFLAKIAQLSEFKAEIYALKKGKGVSKTSKLKALDPFLDENSLLRVGGRLSNADLPFEAKHQIIIPKAVTDLTIEAFIAALKRLCARRGRISTLMSDNATNFKGAAAELNRFIKLICNKNETLANYFASEAIQWKFIPPRSSNFGGLWEAGVKSFKHHLYRTSVNSKVTFEEFETIIIQIEGMLNSRPLVPLSDNINEYEVLTPGHFIIGRPISAIPEPAILKIFQIIVYLGGSIQHKVCTNYLERLEK